MIIKRKIYSVIVVMLLIVSSIYVAPIKEVHAAVSYSFTKVGGGTISSTPVSPKKLNVIVFGRPSCYNTKKTMTAINSSDLLSDSNINFIYADVDGNDEDTIRSFSENYSDNITFCYGDNNNAAWKLSGIGSGSVSLPFVVYVDSTGTVVKSTTDVQRKKDIDRNICKILGYSYDEEVAPIYNLKKVGGGTIPSTPESPKKLNVIVFGRPECLNTQGTLAAINSSDLLFDSNINFIYADVDGNDEDTIRSFSESYSNNITFCYGNNNSAAWRLSGLDSSTLPFMVYIDSNGYVLNSTSGLQTKNVINKNISEILGYSYDEGEESPYDQGLVSDDSYYWVYTNGSLKVDEARGMLSSINSFRNGSDAWYYDRSGNKVTCSNLSGLKYDYRLEKAAIDRATELSLYYSHTRPDGESFNTAISGYWEYTALGENIAMGYNTAAEVFKAWREDEEDYAGQGHRRNMLSQNYNAVGIGCYEVDGVKFWVQEFGYTDFSNAEQTTVASYPEDYSVDIIGSEDVCPIRDRIKLDSEDSIQMTLNDSIDIDLNLIVDEFDVNGQLWYLGYKAYLYSRISIEDKSIVNYSYGNLKALSVGTTYIDVTDFSYETEDKRVTKRIKVTVVEPQQKEDESSGEHSSDNNSSKKYSGSGSSSNENTSYKNEWHGGKWYDNDGKQTYTGTLQWKNNATGWWVEDTDGWYPVDKWQKIDGIWYYFKPDGYMAANEYYKGYWFNSDGSWDEQYFLTWKSNSKGWWVEDISGWWPSSSWLKVDGCWYYFNSSGYMVTSQYVDGWWIGADGVCR